jgi:TolB-like protein/DNA-binding winged helix-turn-helix (wHTH) protein
MSQDGKDLYEFSDFRLDIPERLLTRKGRRIPLPEKAFETLCVLVHEAGHLVTKKTLMSRVWPDTFVEENNLDKSVSLLRQILGDRNGKQKFIETIRGHGYRFVADVRPVEGRTIVPNNTAGTDIPLENSEQSPAGTSMSATNETTPFRKIWFVILVLGIAAIVVGWQLLSRKEQPTALEEIDSLAVLPLKNLSPDATEEYFADGMTEELITKLAGIASIRVISRTSVMEYKKSRKTVPQIAKELNVDAILEGSVLQAGNRVRISTQLIDGATDAHLWADSYERDFQDILTLQNEVATAIVREVQARITPQESAQFANAPIMNAEAYQAYLRGLYYSDREITSENLLLAVQMFQKAVDLDPNFAAAYAQLSRTESSLYFYLEPVPERLSKSKAALDKAFELKPGLPEGHLALGVYYYWGFRDYDHALEQLKIAEKGLPNHGFLKALQAAIYGRQGKWQEALAAQQKAVALNPRHAFTMYNIGYTYFLLRKYSEAQRYFNLCSSLGPDEMNGYIGSALNLVHWKGDIIKAREILNKVPQKNNWRFISHQFWIEFLDRKHETALQTLSSPYVDSIQKHVYSGLVYLQLDKQELARVSFETARNQIKEELHRESGEYSIHGLNGLALAGLRRKKEAIDEGKRAVELLPVSKDASLGPNRIETLAVIYTLSGEPDAAIDQLEYLLSIPSRFSVEMLRLDPLWDPLRNHPRFKKLVDMKRPAYVER